MQNTGFLSKLTSADVMIVYKSYYSLIKVKYSVHTELTSTVLTDIPFL